MSKERSRRRLVLPHPIVHSTFFSIFHRVNPINTKHLMLVFRSCIHRDHLGDAAVAEVQERGHLLLGGGCRERQPSAEKYSLKTKNEEDWHD